MLRKPFLLPAMLLCITLAFIYTSLVSATSPDTAYIDVAVATIWKLPKVSRELDKPSLTNPVELRKWTNSMELIDKMWLVRNLETQALYGQRVKILEENGDWVKVAVAGQPTPRHPDGYPGWMPKAQLTKGAELIRQSTGKPILIVRTPTTWLYHDAALTKPFMEISFNTQLPVLTETNDTVSVITPSHGTKWLSAKAVAIYATLESIPTPTLDELVATAKMFLDLPYLWAGISGFGFDCSGFTHTIYKSYGITIPRDSSVQAQAGTPVKRENLQPGDLLFFAYNNGQGRVHHVAMYIGNGQMIHSPKSERSVEILPLTHPDYNHEYAGARRFITQ